VANVVADSPAARGGLFLGDTVVAVAGEPVRHHDDLLARLGGDQIGQTLSIRVLRGGQVQDVDVVVGEHD
jgi:S1-C subfamily serine protease